MLLRNKKTGKIVKFETDIYVDTEDRTFEFKSIAELNEEWEDYKEPKKYFDFTPALIDDNIVALIVDRKTSREEAEKAVEKLKAWKRLKDKGFKFTNWNCSLEEIKFKVPNTFFDRPDMLGEAISEETTKDLDILFRD